MNTSESPPVRLHSFFFGAYGRQMGRVARLTLGTLGYLSWTKAAGSTRLVGRETVKTACK